MRGGTDNPPTRLYPDRVMWALLWTVLVLGAGATLLLVARSLWRSLLAVLQELDTAFTRISDAARPSRPGVPAVLPELAVFADAAQLRLAVRPVRRPRWAATRRPDRNPRHRAE